MGDVNGGETVSVWVLVTVCQLARAGAREEVTLELE